MAFGKTTIRFFMLVAKEEIVKEADPVPSPPVPKVIELPSHRQKEPIKEPPLNDIPMTGVSTMLIHGKTGQAYTQEEIEQLKETHYISYLWLSYRNVKLNDGSSVIMIVDPSLPSPGEADKLYVPYNSFLGKDGQVYLLDREKFVENITGRGPSQPIPKLNSDGMPIVLGRLKLENGKLVLDSESVSSPGIRDNCIQTNLTPDAVFRTAIFRGSAGSTDLNSEQIFSAFIYLLEKPSQLPSAPVQFDTKSRTGGLIDAGGEL
jgi:hypothetical protein